MSAVPAAAPLDVARARRLTAQLREQLAGALELLHQVHDGRAWAVLGYDTWDAYCDAELPELARLRLPIAERRDAVTTLRGRGMSVRAIAKPLGLSVGTVHADLKAAGDQLATVTSLDGRQRPAARQAAAEPAPVVTGAQRTVDLVTAAGERGLTVRELCRRTGWHHGQASGQLSRLAKRRIRATGVLRDGYVTYVAR